MFIGKALFYGLPIAAIIFSIWFTYFSPNADERITIEISINTTEVENNNETKELENNEVIKIAKIN